MTEEERRKAAAAARTARYRERLKAHKDGNHSQCRPERCRVAWDAANPAAAVAAEGVGGQGGDAGEGVTRDVTPTPKNAPSHREPPAGLGERARQLWDEMSGLKMGPTHVALLERACRKLDRLEAMDAQLHGRAWVDVVEVPNTDGAVLQLVVDKVVGEIRQTEIAFKLDVAELRHAGRAAAAAGLTPPAADEPAEDDDGVKEAAAGGNVTSIAGILGSSRR